MATERIEFENRTQGWVGVTRINRKGDETSINVEPLGRIFLTEEEIEATRQAYRSDDVSPFAVRTIIHRDPMTFDETARFEAPLLERVDRTKRPEAEPVESAPPARRRAAAATG